MAKKIVRMQAINPVVSKILQQFDALFAKNLYRHLNNNLKTYINT